MDDPEVTPPRGLIRAEATLHFWLIRFGRGRQGHHLHFVGSHMKRENGESVALCHRDDCLV